MEDCGSAISEVLADKYPKKLKRLGVKDIFGKSGKAEELLDKYGLSIDNIVNEFLGELKNEKR